MLFYNPTQYQKNSISYNTLILNSNKNNDKIKKSILPFLKN